MSFVSLVKFYLAHYLKKSFFGKIIITKLVEMCVLSTDFVCYHNILLNLYLVIEGML